MSRESADSLAVGPVAAAEMPDALRLLSCRLYSETLSWQSATLLAEINALGRDNQVLLAARRGNQVVGVVWLQIRPGKVGALQPLSIAENESAEEVGVALVESAASHAKAAGVEFYQALLDADSGPEANCLQRCGFRQAADLLYLVSQRDAFPSVKPQSDLEYQSLANSDGASDRLAKVLKQTYQGSQDCPSVQDMRCVDDVLASYRTTGRFDPSRWFIVRAGSSDIGCLLLVEHAVPSALPVDHPLSSLQWELLYMGAIPETRGRGYGLEIVRHAQWLAAQSRAERLAVAVDAANAPAIRVYSATGFQIWDRRSVFLRTK